MSITNKYLKRRAIEISYKHKLSHIGSVLTALDIINDIYSKIGKDDKVVLSQGHAGLALYVVLEDLYGTNAEKMLDECGIHPDRMTNSQGRIDCSSGSLGWGLPIAVGMAIADRTRTVHCVISDGESAEGSIWESLFIARRLKLDNLKIYINDNGYSGYDSTDGFIHELFKHFAPSIYLIPYKTDVDYLPFLKGLEGHYYTMKEADYNLAMEVLK